MRPDRSYTIWFSQRTGSTLLARALESTGVAGKPDEWLLPEDLIEHYRVSYPAALQERLWELESTPNHVCGVKYGFYEPQFTRILKTFQLFSGSGGSDRGGGRSQLWERAFPNGRHIFMTRRNKVRLAVSWWKAALTNEWHRTTVEKTGTLVLEDAYSFDAIRHLYCESVMRECGIQEFFSEGGIVPLTLVYEDFIQDYAGTVKLVLSYLGLDADNLVIDPPCFEKLADEVSDQWAERFREELQRDWPNHGW